MPTITGTIRRPADGSVATGPVTFRLVGTAGGLQPVAHLQSTGAAIEDSTTVDLVAGQYSVVLPDNDDIIPAGTRWQRTHARSGPVLLYVTATPASQSEDDILADPPGALASAALDVHEADTALHGGGQELAIAHLSETTPATSSTSDVDVVGGSITFTVPARRYAVHAFLPFSGDALGVRGVVSLTDVSGSSLYATDSHRFEFNGQTRTADLWLRVPSLMAGGHDPPAGSEVTYKLRVKRDAGGAAGTVQVPIVFPTTSIVISEAFLEAVTR